MYNITKEAFQEAISNILECIRMSFRISLSELYILHIFQNVLQYVFYFCTIKKIGIS